MSRVAALLSVLVLVVPAYLGAAIAEDTVLGDGSFLFALEIGGKRRLAEQLLAVALESSVFLLPFAVVSFVALRRIERRVWGLFAIVGLALSLGLVLSHRLVPALGLTALALWTVDLATTRLFARAGA